MISQDKAARLWLAYSESLTYKGRERLIELYGSAIDAYNNLSSNEGNVIGAKAFDELISLKAKGLDYFYLELEKAKAKAVFLGDENYPYMLKEIQDPPDVLFYYGNLPGDDYKAISIVGSRKDTRYGSKQAFSIARDLSLSGVIVVSGLAYGIDAAAHKGVVDSGGKTIAVLGSGIKNIYPKDHIPLAREIIKLGGAIISEYPLYSKPLAYHFPVRNRIVSGLSHGVLLIEAREKSGTLITVSHALNQGREVFALPGQVDAPGSLIPHSLLRDGARLATCADDIIEDMGWGNAENKVDNSLNIEELNLTNEQGKIYHALCVDSLSFEELLEKTQLSASEANTHIVIMQMQGIIEALPGGMYRLNN